MISRRTPFLWALVYVALFALVFFKISWSLWRHLLAPGWSCAVVVARRVRRRVYGSRPRIPSVLHARHQDRLRSGWHVAPVLSVARAAAVRRAADAGGVAVPSSRTSARPGGLRGCQLYLRPAYLAHPLRVLAAQPLRCRDGDDARRHRSGAASAYEAARLDIRTAHARGDVEPRVRHPHRSRADRALVVRRPGHQLAGCDGHAGRRCPVRRRFDSRWAITPGSSRSGPTAVSVFRMWTPTRCAHASTVRRGCSGSTTSPARC